MSDQFTKPAFARGVKLAIQHVYTTLADLQAAAAIANVERTSEQLAPCRIAWVDPWIGSESVKTAGKPAVIWPFTLPPFQQLFQRSTLRDPDYPVTLAELSFGWDQRGEPGGIVSPESTSIEGKITSPDMDRYGVVLSLFERQPSLVAGNNPMAPREVLRLEIDGVNAFGNQFARTNPLLIEPLNIALKPFMVYYWQLSVPGLYSADGVVPGPPAPTVEQLAMPSVTLTATILSPLTVRDRVTDLAAPGVQNIPVKHQGAKTGTPVALTTPVANGIITGDDVQAGMGGFDSAARDRMPSGYGIGHGAVGDPMQAADAPPTEMLANDAYYSVIMVPMWHGQRHNSIRSVEVPTAYMPYAPDPFVAPWAGPTEDRVAIRVPGGFVLHHAFAVWNVYSPPDGVAPVGATYRQRVGVGIQCGLRCDNFTHQQVALLDFTPNTAATFLLDSFDLDEGATPCYRLLQIPLVNAGAAWNANSWLASGRPFFMGDANTTTAFRSNSVVAGVFATPLTAGGETMLEVRWEKSDDPAVGLDGGPAQAVRVGQGGEWVILVGKQTVAA